MENLSWKAETNSLNSAHFQQILMRRHCFFVPIYYYKSSNAYIDYLVSDDFYPFHISANMFYWFVNYPENYRYSLEVQ